jgi:hypothetical protein
MFLWRHLNPTATGLDNLPSWFLKISVPFIAVHVSDLFNMSINSSVVPVQWKQAEIVPIPKISLPKMPVDFRPISVTPVLSRLLEKNFVQRFLYPAFTKLGYLSDSALCFAKAICFPPHWFN